MDKPNITISKLLKDLQDPTQDLSAQSAQYELQPPSVGQTFQPLNFYSSKIILSGRQKDSYTWQQILQSNSITSNEQLNKIYSTINHKILQLKYSQPAVGSIIMDEQINENPVKQTYLTLKSETFHRMYLPESSFNEDFATSKWGFDILELQLFAKEISSLQQKLAVLVQNISEENRWFLKIETLYLLHQIASLLKEISIAAYPFGPENKVIEVLDVEIPISTLEKGQSYIIINKQMNKIRQLETQKAKEFGNFLSSHNYIGKALQILCAKIEASDSNSQVDPFRQFSNNNQLRSQNGFTNISHSLQELKGLDLIFRLAEFTANNRQKEISAQSIQDIIDLDPFKHFSNQTLQELLPVLSQLKQLMFNYYLFYYQLINRLKHNEEIPSQKAIFSCFQLMQKSLTISQNDLAALIHHQNLIQLIKMAKNNKHSQLYKTKKKSIESIFSVYLGLLRKKMDKQTLFLKIQMQRVDQLITYKLLTNQQLLHHFASYQTEINASLNKMMPIMLMQQKIKKIREHFDQNKMSFDDLIGSFEYLSLLSERSLRNLEKRLPKSRYDNNNIMDKIVDICQSNPELTKRIPHLLELRNTLILIEVLKTAKRKTKINHQNSFIDFKYLQEVADYFSFDRSQCKIYQLKSKILLFVILFKMGHYIPKMVQNRSMINLRQRIINLMIRQVKSDYHQSRLTPSVIRKGSVASSIYVYNHEQVTISRISRIMEDRRNTSIEIKASQELNEKIREYISDLSSRQDNWVGYITQRLNLMEHELFMNERNAIKREEEYLCQQYLEHIQNSLGYGRQFKNINEREFQIFLKIQKYFFQEKYERGWELLDQQQLKNKKFEMFLDKVLQSVNNQIQSYKFLKIYRQFSKIQSYAKPLLTQNQESIDPEQIAKLMVILNENTLFPLDQQQVLAALNYLQRRTVTVVEKLPESQAEFLSFEISQHSKIIHPAPNPFSLGLPIANHRLSSLEGISVTQKDSQTKLVTIIKGGRKLGNQIQEYTRVFTQLSSKGISKIKSINYYSGGQWKENIIIEIQQNSYGIQNFEMLQEQDVFEEKVVRTLLDRIVQVLRLFLTKQKFIDFGLHRDEIIINFETKTISIDPCLVALEKIINKSNKNKSTASILQSIQSVIEPFRHKFSKHFQYNYSVLLKTLKNIRSFSLENLSSIFNSSLMLSRPQQAELILNFQQKMAQHYRSFDGLYKLPRDSTFLLKKRMELLADSKIKNYTYYFKIGSVFEQQIIEQQICKTYLKPPNAKASFIWFDQKNTDDDLFDIKQLKSRKQLKYAFQELIKRLKKALIESDKHETIKKINARFPKLIHFIRRSIKLLDQPYQKVITDKNAWVCNILADSLTVESIKQSILCKKQLQYQKILKYEQFFKQNVHSRAAEYLKKYYRCAKCSIIFQAIIKIPENQPLILIQFLAQICKLIPKNRRGFYSTEGVLSDEHSAINCFLAEKLAQHPAVQIYGEQIKKPLAKYYVIVNWWFFLEYNFPFLVDVISQVHHQLSLVLLDEL